MTSRSFQQPGLLLTLFFSLFLISTPVTAGILKIETETTVEVSGDRLSVSVSYSNKGTAPAYNLQVHSDTLGRQEASPVVAHLDPGQSEQAFFKRKIKAVRKGCYPMTVRVDFHDANQYPFSALSGMTFHMGEAVNPNLAVLSHDIILDKSGMLRFNVKNLGGKPEKIIATLVLPKELSSSKPKRTFKIDPRTEKVVDVEIRNFSALPGANYPVFCYFEYDAKDTHHTVLARSLVTIAKDENLFRRFRWIWMTLAAILAALLILILIRDRMKKSRANRPDTG
ncbi:MAG: hypothetical protein JRL30_15160 [Deltaproteobacteria bacterium]|nr:hypothetical protein [Deltaproteobacteria bacterium]